MKVTLLSPTIEPTNGYGNITLELCSRLQHQIDLTLLLPKFDSTPPIRLQKCRILKILPPFIHDLKNVAALNYLLWCPPALQSDLIHSLFAFPYAYLARRLAKLMEKPLIVGVQGTYGVRPLFQIPEKWLLKTAYDSAKWIHVPSRYTEKKIKELSLTKTKIMFIPNGVDFNRFQKKQDLCALKKQYQSGPILLGVGALKERKGFDVVIKAVAILKKKFPSIKYLLAGEGEMQFKLKSLANELNLTNIFFLGNKVGNELVSLYQFCDIYVHTPRVINWNFEGFGIVYLEAGACGKPVVASKSGGVPSAVIDGKTGILVPENSVNATTEAIEKLLKDKKLYKKLEANGRAWAQKHDWSLVTEKYLSLYERVYENREISGNTS